MKTKLFFFVALALLSLAACQNAPKSPSPEQAKTETPPPTASPSPSAEPAPAPEQEAAPDPALLKFLAHFEDWTPGQKYSGNVVWEKHQDKIFPLAQAQKYLGEKVEQPKMYGQTGSDFAFHPLGKLVLPSKKYAILHYLHVNGGMPNSETKMVLFDLKSQKVVDQINAYQGLCKIPPKYGSPQIQAQCEMEWLVEDVFQVTAEGKIQSTTSISCPAKKSFSCQISVDESTGRFVR